MRALVVMPTYQEAECIATTVADVLVSDVNPDVLVVDDSSPDGTGDIVERLAAQLPVGRLRLLRRHTKDGLGAAYRSGFDLAISLDYEVIVQMDADGSHPASALPRMFKELDNGADVVLASRYSSGGEVAREWPWFRKVLSRGGNVYAQILLTCPVRDLTGGFKAWRTSCLKQLDFKQLNASGYAFQIQTTIAALDHGARVVEVPFRFVEREYGTSKMSASIVLEAVTAVVRMRGARQAARLRRGGEAPGVPSRPSTSVPTSTPAEQGGAARA